MTNPVREVILEPMRALYPPPQHLRANSEGLSLALAAYEKALARFDRQTLERGWDKIVAEQTFWCWPNPGEIADACRQCMPHPRPPSDEERRKQQAMDLADTYTTRYMKTSQVAKLARREGWSERLREYVYDAAWVQAQLIAGVNNIGWNTQLAQGGRAIPVILRRFRGLSADDPPDRRKRPCPRYRAAQQDPRVERAIRRPDA